VWHAENFLLPVPVLIKVKNYLWKGCLANVKVSAEWTDIVTVVGTEQPVVGQQAI